jgi:lipopolysaccharide transport system permease protein
VPDLRYIVNYGMTMLFFLSGIFFSVDAMTPEAQSLLRLNPVLVVIEAYRDVLLNGTWPPYLPLAAIGVTSSALIILVAVIFRRLDRVYPRVVG